MTSGYIKGELVIDPPCSRCPTPKVRRRDKEGKVWVCAECQRLYYLGYKPSGSGTMRLFWILWMRGYNYKDDEE